MPDESSAGNAASALTLRAVVEEFLYHEAALLDAWRLDEWLALFTADGRYMVPTTSTPPSNSRKESMAFCTVA